MKKNIIYLILIILLSFWAVRPLAHFGFFPMHDDELIARLYGLHQALLGGQFPPRWIEGLGFGFGYPFYNFYPPLVYYVGEIFHFLGFSLINSTKIVMGLGFVLSGVFMYLLANQFFNKAAALISAVFYIYAPYHALDLYVRGALAEFYAFVFAPALFWSTYKLIKKSNLIWLAINSLFLAGLLLSHNLTAIIVIPFNFVFFAYFCSWEKNKKKTWLKYLLSGLVFVGLTAFFWMPALVEKKYTLVNEILTRELASYRLHFVYLRQLWHSPWGYGGSIFGLEDGISFEIGKLHLIFALLSIPLTILLLKRKRWLGFVLGLFLVLLGLSIYMSSFHSQFIWDLLKPLWYLQFPWRFLILAVFFSSLIAGGVVDYLGQLLKKRYLYWSMLVVILSLVILNNYRYFQPSRYLSVSDGNYLTDTELKWRVSKMSFEFIPNTVATKLSDIGTTQIDINEDEIAEDVFKVVSGDVQARETLNTSHRKILATQGKGVIQFQTYYFPGWQAYVDGEAVPANPSGKLKLITVDIPEGEHQVEIIFTNTMIRSIANYLSLVSLAFLFLIFFQKKDVRVMIKSKGGRDRLGDN